MNLHQIVRDAISSVNPNTYVTIKKFSKYTIDDAGKITNEYSNYYPDLGHSLIVATFAQIQPISGERLQHLANYNSSNVYVRMFVNGEEHGLSEALSTNGDIVIFNNQTWKIVEVPGLWRKSGWNEVILCLQDDKNT